MKKLEQKHDIEMKEAEQVNQPTAVHQINLHNYILQAGKMLTAEFFLENQCLLLRQELVHFAVC